MDAGREKITTSFFAQNRDNPRFIDGGKIPNGNLLILNKFSLPPFQFSPGMGIDMLPDGWAGCIKEQAGYFFVQG
jgi:hypothetical protein